MSIASDSLETIGVIIKLGTVTGGSNMRTHHVLITLTFTFIQGHIDLNHEDNKCSIMSETFQAKHIKFAVKIAQLKDDITCACRWPWHSFKITTVSQTGPIFIL